MENIINENIDNNINNNIIENVTKECPYCNIILSSIEFQDHILCHEIDQNENGNLSNNVNGYGLKNNNNNDNQTQKFNNHFNNFINFFKPNKNNINNTNNINNVNNINSNNSTNDGNNKINIKEKITPYFNKVTDFFKNISIKKDDDDSDSSSDDSSNIFHSIRFPRIRFGRRRSSSEDSNEINENNESNENNNELLFDDVSTFNELLTLNKEDAKEILKYIPTSEVKEERKPTDNNYKCIICLSEFKVGEVESTLPCLHIFHSECIEKWLNNKKFCPICKNDISLKSLLSKDNY